MDKEKIRQYLLENSRDLYRIRKQLYENPEIGLEEVNASQLLMQLLKKEGFTVAERFCNMPTGFKAEYDSGKPGAVIAFISEYDALPEIGHACGHNIIAAMGYGAAIGLKHVIDEAGGKVILFGTPDEERTSGKVTFVEEHAFDEVDVVIMSHPYPFSEESGVTMGLGALKFEFIGKSAHAAQPKEYCKNSLDALVMAYLNINNLKQYIPEANIYGIIDNGGSRPNIIPDYASMKYYIRAANKFKLQEYMERITDCVIYTAKASNVDVHVTEFEKRVENLVTNHTLANIFKGNYELLSSQRLQKPIGYAATSDIGNVSNVVPTIHSWISIGDNKDKALHNIEFAEATMTDEAGLEMLYTAIAMAQTGLDILKSPDLLKEIKKEFSDYMVSMSTAIAPKTC